MPPDRLRREGAGGPPQGLAALEGHRARGHFGFAGVDPLCRPLGADPYSCKSGNLHKIRKRRSQWRADFAKQRAAEEGVRTAPGESAARTVIGILASPGRVAFQPCADVPALLVCGSVMDLTKPGTHLRLGKAEVSLDTLLAWSFGTLGRSHVLRAEVTEKFRLHPRGSALGAATILVW